MRELELAVHPSIDAAPPRSGGRARPPRPSAAFVASVAVHAIAGYALVQHRWASEPPRTPSADFFLFEIPAARPEPAPEQVPADVPRRVEEPQAPPPPRAAESVSEPAPASEPARAAEAEPPSEPVPADEAQPTPAPYVDFDEERLRAAREVVEARAADREYLTFSIDDVAPPRPEPEAEPAPSIFDAGGPNFGGRSVGTVGQQRTRIGRKLAELCNALTGGFGAAFQGFGLFSACASPDDGPSGLFPEVRPAYLDLMPECVDTRDTAPALALEAPFPTVKCRLVERPELEALP